MHLSERSQCMPTSPIRKLVPYADAAKAAGRKVYHLNIGQPDVVTPEPMWEAIRSYREKVIEYGPSNGLRPLREATCHYYGRLGFSLQPEHVTITTGGSEAILFAYSVIADAGDEIIVFEPFYANYNGFACTLGLKLVPITLSGDNDFRLPPKDVILSKITPRTRGIQICSPNNPTGKVLSHQEMQELVEIAMAKDLFIISDEVYREFAYDGQKVTSVLEFPKADDRTIVIDSVSKRFSACGARVGGLISRNLELQARVLKYGQARLCPPTLGQIAAEAAYRMNPGYFDPVREDYQSRRNTVVSALKDMPGVSCAIPGGAFYLMAKLPVDDAEKFATYLLTDFQDNGETVMVAPGDGFYATPGMGKQEIRIAYVLQVPKLERAMEILAAAIPAYNKR
ncbi:MAG: pyridoxal phosphate-dependent aminotransferase [Planctomycetota bacterium]